MAVYEATVTRVRYVHTVIEVEADSPEQAREQAEQVIDAGVFGQPDVSHPYPPTVYRWTSHNRAGVLGHDEYEIAEIA